MTSEEFIAYTKKVTGPRKHQIKNSVGSEDFIYHYLKQHKELPVPIIRSIIKQINLELQDCLSNGVEIKLPRSMGALELRSIDSYVKFKNGKIKTNRPIDWNATLQLWYKYPETKQQKKLVRTESKKIFQIFYNKGKAKYTNKVFFEFIPNRTLKQKIKENIQNGLIKDTFILNG